MTGDGWQSPMSIALCCVVIFAATYEPARQILLHAQEVVNVGGVGGVGGLANMGSPSDEARCAGYQHQYCYEEGYRGLPFTPFALATLSFWVGPLLIACCVGSYPTVAPTSTTETSTTSSSAWAIPVWLGLNVLWFVVPWLTFGLGLKGIGGWWTRQVLAIALAASHPLSWNLSLVMIPTGGVLSKIILVDEAEASTKKRWFVLHRLLGYTTAFWGALHAVGEIFYFLSSEKRLRTLWRIRTDGETLIYWLGVLCFVLLVCHVGAAYFRRVWWPEPSENFATFHSAMAAVFLIVAAAHWWPFAILLVPATAVHGTNVAFRLHRRRRRFATTTTMETLTSRQASAALGLSLIGALTGLCVVWSWRQTYMMSPKANLYVPFAFPALSVLASSATSCVAAALFLRVITNTRANDDDDDDDDEHGSLTPEAKRFLNNESIALVNTPLLANGV